MTRFADILLPSLLLAACGRGSESRSDIDACTLLTSEEIQAATGWAPDTSASRAYGTTRTCAYHGKDAVKQSVVLVVATPAPKVSTSAELAALRNEQAQRPAGHLPVQLQGSSREHVRQGRSEVVQGGGAVSRKRSDDVD
jgi:hypothetical protein